MRVCSVCGTSSLATVQCPACGALFDQASSGAASRAEPAAANAVIDVQVLEVKDSD
jgi:uncharacterized membrane protein YvbJ